MSKTESIGHREALTLLIIMLTGKIFLSFPRNMVLLGDGAAWIIVLLAGIYSLVAYYFIYALLKRYPSFNIIEISRKVTGNIFGIIFGVVIFLFFLVITSMYLRQFSESYLLAILPRTPISIITIFFLCLLSYGSLLGIETLTRVAWLYGPYLLAALVIILIFSLPQASFHFLTPVLGPGPIPLLLNSIIHISVFSEILLLSIFAPMIHQQEKVFRVGLYSLLVATLINTGITALATAVFNYAATKKLVFPIFQLTRLISLTEFVQRVEAGFVFLCFFWAGIQLGGLFYGTLASFAQTFKIKNYRPLIPAMGILVFALSIIPTSMTQAVDLNSYSTHNFLINSYYALVAFGIPFLLWLISTLKKKFGGSYE